MEDQAKMEKKRSMKTEHEPGLSKEYVRALSLLFSAEAKSAEELRAMLEIEIAKQKQPKRPKLQASRRRSKRLKANVDAAAKKRSTSEKSVKKNNEIHEKKGNAACHLNPSADEEVENRDDVPRISIPDEDQNDGAVCKVCNVPEFGPLTLTQCNICEKYYHPLCHQPPIVDGYFQEPNSFWHCGECRKNDQT